MAEEMYWQQGDTRAYPALRGRRTADAVIIGGGLTGLTVALWLCRAGLRVILLEARTLGSGSSACCLGRVSLLGGTSLARLEKRFGQEGAAACVSARQNALYALREMSREDGAFFGWHTLDDRVLGSGKALFQEAEAFRRAGVAFETEKAFSSRFTGEDSLMLRDMAALHPLRYLHFLARQGETRGLKIFEHSRVIALETNLASTERGSVQAPYIVVATGYPIVNIPGWYFLRTVQRKGCLIPLNDASGLESMLSDLDGRFAIRPLQRGALAQLSLLRVGEKSDCSAMELCREKLSPYLESLPSGPCYDGTEVYSADGLPYIGPYGRRTPNLYVAAAYSGQGILGSVTAAQIISARILGLRCDGDFLFSGQRKAAASRVEALKTCCSIGTRYLGGLFRTRAPRCPHLGCRMRFNPSSRLWECPCHGSQFDGIGHWRNGPAVHDATIRRR